MVGIDIISAPTVFLGIPFEESLGHVVLAFTVLLGIIVIMSHLTTRLLKKVI